MEDLKYGKMCSCILKENKLQLDVMLAGINMLINKLRPVGKWGNTVVFKISSVYQTEPDLLALAYEILLKEEADQI